MQTSILKFDQFELDLNSYELRKWGRVVKLERLPTELLILLVENQGQLVTREQIIERLWGDNVFVDTRQGINTAVGKLRNALQDDSGSPPLLQTLVGRGYRLLAPVSGPVGASGQDVDALSSPTLSVLPPEITATEATPRPRLRQLAFYSVPFTLCAVAFIAWFSSRSRPNGTPVEQRLTSNSMEAPIKFAVVSPDGRYLAYADPTGLYLRHIETGETRRWMLPSDFVASPCSWFPDSVHLLVTRLEGPMRTPSLWVISLLGGNPRKVMDHAGPGWVSPDGSQIAFLTVPEWGHQLWLMKADGSDRHMILTSSRPEPPSYRESMLFPVTWSPDGRHLAYIERHAVPAPDPAEDAFSSLRVCEGDGRNSQVILNDPRLGLALTRTADGRILFAYREDAVGGRSDQQVRSIKFDHPIGNTVRPLKFVASGVGRIGGMSATSDGKRLVLWRINTQMQVFIAKFDAATRKWKELRRLTLDANSNLAEAWMSDSRSVLFVSNRKGTWTLFKQQIDETTAEVLVEGRSIFLPRLSTDRSQVLFESRAEPVNYSVPVSLMRLPAVGGSSRLILQESGVVNYQCAHQPSTLCIFSQLQGSDHVFVSFDPERGPGREVLRIKGSFDNWSLSPDGNTLATFPGDHRIRFFKMQNGAMHEIKTVTLNDWRVQNGDWSADGLGVLIPTTNPAGLPVLLETALSGKTTAVLEGDRNTTFDAMVSSPDGHLGILDVEVPGDNNAWMIEKF